MSRDIYTSLSGAKAAWRTLETVANNVANTNTDGFKAIKNRYESVQRSYWSLGNTQLRAAQDGADMRDGSVKLDGDKHHFALQGRGFFEVMGDGGKQLQRGGSFHLDNLNYLVTSTGAKVLGRSGPIEVPWGEEIRVSEDGAVFTTSGIELDTLSLVDADEVVPLGGTRWEAKTPTYDAKEVTVLQGALETSNVDPMASMITLIEASRQFEIFQKALRTSDQMDAQIQKVGRT